MNLRRAGTALALTLAAALTLVGCSTEGSDLASQYREGGGKGYIEGDGSTLSIPMDDRKQAVEYSGTDESGAEYGSADTRGEVTVVNFWYAGCAPCRVEAPDLVKNYTEFSPQGVKFVGVNTRDQVAQAQQFSQEFGIEYPSIMDNAGGRAVQRAFAGQVPLNAVPTTLVLDREGRVAHRVLGQIAADSQLRTLIEETLAETGDSADQPSGSSKQ